jgi:hypothetical protein
MTMCKNILFLQYHALRDHQSIEHGHNMVLLESNYSSIQGCELKSNDDLNSQRLVSDIQLCMIIRYIIQTEGLADIEHHNECRHYWGDYNVLKGETYFWMAVVQHTYDYCKVTLPDKKTLALCMKSIAWERSLMDPTSLFLE